MDDVIKDFINECFIKDIISGENSVYINFFDEGSANNHDTLANNNSNDAYISKNVNDVENAITQGEIKVHPNSNFDNITDANIPAINKEKKINSFSKVTILDDLKSFLKRVQKFNSNIEKRKQEPDKMDDENKLLETREDGKWKKGTTLMMGDSILSELREHNFLDP